MLANVEATVTIICGTIVALQAAWITYRLKQQDNARDAARVEMKATAATVKNEVAGVADATHDKLEAIHVLVNSRMSEATDRITQLEAKLGLAAGEEIPGPPTITKPTNG